LGANITQAATNAQKEKAQMRNGIPPGMTRQEAIANKHFYPPEVQRAIEEELRRS